MINLRKFRNDKGLQRRFVALKIGICSHHLTEIEAGKVNLTDNIANKLSELYNIPINEVKEMYKEVQNEKRKHTRKTIKIT